MLQENRLQRNINFHVTLSLVINSFYYEMYVCMRAQGLTNTGACLAAAPGPPI